MNPTFKIGDVVVLKSGSMSMTVNSLSTNYNGHFNGYVNCKWHSDGKIHEEEFHQDSLELE